MITESLIEFLHSKQIDSFHKLRLLLFFYQYPQLTWTVQQIIKRLYFGDLPLLERILNDLRAVGLVDCTDTYCRLRKEPAYDTYLENLQKAFEDPMLRQQVLARLSHRSGSVAACSAHIDPGPQRIMQYEGRKLKRNIV